MKMKVLSIALVLLSLTCVPTYRSGAAERARFSDAVGQTAAAAQARSTLPLPPQSASGAQRGATPHVTDAHVKAALPELEKLAEDALDKTGVPGMAIAVVYKGQVVYLKGFGVKEAGTHDLVDPDTVFQLASLSKPIASTIVAGVIGDGKASWDSRISELDPAFQLYDPWVTRQVTLRDMFAHRSGLPAHAGDLLEDLGFDRATILYRLRYQKPDSSFRSAYAYTNFGLTEASVAAAKAAGTVWEDLAAETLYHPLGMQHTSSRTADFLAALNRARGHVLVDDKWVAKYHRDPDPQSPAGGVSSTARDMAQWLRLQLNNGKVDGKQIIGADALAETHRPQIIRAAPQNPATDRAGFYGLGWNVDYDDQGHVSLSHSGAFALGAATAVTLLPSEELGIVVLTNAYPIGVPEAMNRSFLDLVLQGKVTQDWVEVYRQLFATAFKPDYGTAIDYTKPPVLPSPALPATAYVGTYHNAFFGDIEIVAKAGRLVLHVGPQSMEFPMQHYNRDVFIYQPVGENAWGLSGITFTIGPDQTATSVVVENLNIHGNGTFMRVLDN